MMLIHEYSQLHEFYCIELRELTQERPKGAKCRNYTKDKTCWFRYPYVPNRYGILLQPNNLIIVDIDKPEFMPVGTWPLTFTVKTGGGGYHLYYKNKYNIELDHSPPWGEIKTNGHVVGPNVQHENGSIYIVEKNIGINTLKPLDIPQLLQHRPRRGGAGVENNSPTQHTISGTIAGYPDLWPDINTIKHILYRKTKVLQQKHHKNKRSGHDFLIALTLAEHGIHKEVIEKALYYFGSSKIKKEYDRRRKFCYVSDTVENAILHAQNNPLSVYKHKRETLNGTVGENQTMANGFVKEKPKVEKVYHTIQTKDRNGNDIYYCLNKKRLQDNTFLSLDMGYLQDNFDQTDKVLGPAKSWVSFNFDQDLLNEIAAGFNKVFSEDKPNNGGETKKDKK